MISPVLYVWKINANPQVFDVLIEWDYSCGCHMYNHSDDYSVVLNMAIYSSVFPYYHKRYGIKLTHQSTQMSQ